MSLKKVTECKLAVFANRTVSEGNEQSTLHKNAT